MRKTILVIIVTLLLLGDFSMIANASAGTIYETESNNTHSTADVTYNDYDNYGKISSSSDIDWWKFTTAYEGCCNVWLGSIPSGCDYDLYLYSSNGTTLLASSTKRTGSQELIRFHLSANTQYKVKIQSYSGYSTSKNYKFRVFNYPLTPAHTKNLLWNIESIYYYVDSSASIYTSTIADAAYNWVYTGYGWNNLYPNTQTSNKYYSAIDFYSFYSPPVLIEGKWVITLGETTHYAREYGTYGDPHIVNADTEDWLFNEIKINDYSYSSNPSSSFATIVHEFGHAFGLAHNNDNVNSIMCQDIHDRAVSTVQDVDHWAFVKKYP